MRGFRRVTANTITGSAENGAIFGQSSQTGSRLGLTLRETPASIELISQEAMQQRGARTLEEALRGAAGLTVGGNPASPGIASTRGFTGGFITYLFDGVRISTPTIGLNGEASGGSASGARPASSTSCRRLVPRSRGARRYTPGIPDQPWPQAACS